jgi:hypothetical protein
MGKWVSGIVFMALLSACASGGDASVGSTSVVEDMASSSSAAQDPGMGSTSPTTGADPEDQSTTTPPAPAPGCSAFDGEPFQNADVVAVSSLPGSSLGIRGVVYPHPDYEGNPWSEWGQGVVVDGRFYSAIGDHLGAEGNSYIYEFDPDAGTLTRIADVASLVGPTTNDWGHGKIHAQMVTGPCGEIYAATYWGTRRGIDSVDYTGGVLIRIDPTSRTVANLGAPVPGFGIPSLASWPEGGLIYAEAADPNQPTGTNAGPFFVYDVRTGEVIFSNDDASHTGFRSMAVGPGGRAYVTFGEGSLSVYDPASNSMVDSVSIPGGRLRAATAPASDGTIYAASDRPEMLFSIGRDGTVTDYGALVGYTASMALDDEWTKIYFVPGAHGAGYSYGTPLVEFDPSAATTTDLVELAPLIEDRFGLRAGGTYGIAIDEAANRIFMALNAGPENSRDTFGEVVLVEVTLP